MNFSIKNNNFVNHYFAMHEISTCFFFPKPLYLNGCFLKEGFTMDFDSIRRGKISL